MSKRLERIENYLAGQMSPVDQHQFEADLLQDSTLKEDLDQMQLIQDALEVGVEDKLRSHLNALASQQKPPREKRKIRSIYIWSSVAVALFILAIGLWWSSNHLPEDPSQYASLHYIEYERSGLRSQGNINTYQPAIQLLKEGDTSRATLWMNQWIEANRTDMEAVFVLADMRYQMGRLQNAGDLFLQIAKSSSILWGEKSAWNFLVVAQQNAWNSDAETILNSILENPDHSYYDQALKLDKIRR